MVLGILCGAARVRERREGSFVAVSRLIARVDWQAHFGSAGAEMKPMQLVAGKVSIMKTILRTAASSGSVSEMACCYCCCCHHTLFSDDWYIDSGESVLFCLVQVFANP